MKRVETEPECIGISENSAPNLGLLQPDSEKNIRVGSFLKTAVRFAMAASIGIGATSLFGDTSVQTEHVSVGFHTELKPSLGGGTTLDTPIGDVSYPTHLGPLGFSAVVEDIPVAPAISLVRGGRDRPKISTTLEQEAQIIGDSAKNHALKSLAILASVSGSAWMLSGEKGRKISKKSLASSLLTGTLIAGIPTLSALASFDSDALNKPEYSGLLAFGLKNQDVIKILDSRDQDITKQANYLFPLLDAVEKLNSTEEKPTALRVVLVSDIHGRSIYKALKSIIDSYDISFVLDAGDIVDLGIGAENGFFLGSENDSWRKNSTAIADLGVPYYFVRGNHDRENTTVAALRKIDNVTVLDQGKYFKENGLVITGAGDPVFSPDKAHDKDTEKDKEVALGEDVQQLLGERMADIVMLHNPLAAKQIENGAQMTISGHTHKFDLDVPSKSSEPIRLVSGTTGGAGLRVFDNEAKTETEQNFTILNYSSDCQPVSLDVIKSTTLSDTPQYYVEHIPLRKTTDSGIDSGRKCDNND